MKKITIKPRKLLPRKKHFKLVAKILALIAGIIIILSSILLPLAYS